MKQGWEIKKLGELVNIKTGKLDSNAMVDGGKYPFFTCSREIFAINDYAFDCEAILLAGNNASGDFNVKHYKGKFNAYQRTYIITVNAENKILYSYLYQQLTNHLKRFKEQSVGTNTKFLKIGMIQGMEIPLPPLPEQQRIVAILDEAFAAINKAKANAEQNLKNAKELFESYLQGVFENGKWQTKKWGELCDFVRGPFGGSLKKNVFKESGYVVYEQKHAIHNHFNQLRYFIDEEKFNEMKRFEVFPGDIILSCSGVTLGRVAIVPEGIPKGIINQALLKLTPKKNVNVHFITHWFRSSIFQKIIFDYSGGAAIPNVPSAKILKEIKIPCPSLKEQEKIVTEIEIVLNESKRLQGIYQRKISDLEELKKSILQKAFAGELATEKTETKNKDLV